MHIVRFSFINLEFAYIVPLLLSVLATLQVKFLASRHQKSLPKIHTLKSDQQINKQLLECWMLKYDHWINEVQNRGALKHIGDLFSRNALLNSHFTYLHTVNELEWPFLETRGKDCSELSQASAGMQLCVDKTGRSRRWINTAVRLLLSRRHTTNKCWPTIVGQHLCHIRQHFVGQQYGGDGGLSRRRRRCRSSDLFNCL